GSRNTRLEKTLNWTCLFGWLLHKSNSGRTVGRAVAPTLSKDVESGYVSTKKCSNVEPLNKEASRQISNFYQHLKTDTGKTWSALQSLSVSSPDTNCKETQDEIAEE
ncbi:hypothetical protein LSAT2_026886, partial [Lamellibrachia satsuma]